MFKIEDFDAQKEKAAAVGKSSSRDRVSSDGTDVPETLDGDDHPTAARRELLADEDLNPGDRLGVSTSASEMDISAS